MVAKNRRRNAAGSSHLWSARKSAIDDLISTIQTLAPPPSGHQIPPPAEASGISLTLANPSERKKPNVPRATDSAVCDWRRSVTTSSRWRIEAHGEENGTSRRT